VPNGSLSQTTIDGYKTDVNTARTNIATSQSSVLSSEEKTRSARTALEVATEDYNLLKAGSTEAQIKIAEAKVAQAEANIQKIHVQISQSLLSSPISGTITKQDAKVGQVTSAGQNLVSIISNGDLEIEAQIPEIDVGRVAVSNPVRITVDAFPGDEYVGVVRYIDPAETIIDGVVNYKSTIDFGTVPEKARSGLTVNLYIETASKQKAIIIPQFAVLETDEGTFVQKDVNGNKVKTPITLGIRGENGMLEVLSGLSAGDRVYNVGLR